MAARGDGEAVSECALYCGDAVEQMRLLPDAFVDCVVTDPPYPEIDSAMK